MQRYYDTGREGRGDIITRPQRMSIAELCAADTPRSRGYLRRRLVEEGLKTERCALTDTFAGRRRAVA